MEKQFFFWIWEDIQKDDFIIPANAYGESISDVPMEKVFNSSNVSSLPGREKSLYLINILSIDQ